VTSRYSIVLDITVISCDKNRSSTELFLLLFSINSNWIFYFFKVTLYLFCKI